ncbi:P-loop containing nucleoside triphosphate hydrolase protein [Corynespora cassiicola Philippines]|uniref:P-loop containing nucleoside triphosphate hydrolase protein n=1 Tax=Corynespora cassiicola Philippines TaxID=1448308 RepID=A0A2T2NXS1_CORCC|nr:P-loop containing nucleoside triphosphate hydrolase protein [Corynespora cassiicola Philippines]
MAASLDSTPTDEQEKSAPDDEELDFVQRMGWKALFAFTTRKHVPVLVAALAAAVISALTLPAIVIVFGRIFGQFAEFGAGKITGTVLMHRTSENCIYLVALAAGNWLANSAYLTLFFVFGELQARSARDKIFDALTQKDMAWYDTRESGMTAFLPGVQMQVRDLQLALSGPFGEGVQSVVMGTGALIIAMYYSWNLTLITISTIPLAFVFMAYLSTRFKKRGHQQADKLQEALKYATNAIKNIETVKCYNGEHFEVQRYAGIIKLAAGLYKRQANVRSLQVGFMQFVTLSIFVQGFWFGSYLVMSGARNTGQVLTTFWAALTAVDAVTAFMPQFVVLQEGKIAGARLRMIFTQISEHNIGLEKQGNVRPGRCAGDIEFREVSFTYPTRPEQAAIDNVFLFFAAGETSFVIGKSGSGKSTLGQLLVRFYKPISGQIFLDKTALDTLDTQWLRENITLVEQHSVLFNDTIRHNIAMGRKNGDVDSSEIEAAISFAMLEQMTQDLPEGLETLVGIKGDAMSGGQRQRMALARARIRDTPILILDESTSALDYTTRTAIHDMIRKWRKGKTTIVITHDVSQIRGNDFVYVLENAQVVQEGYRKMLEADPESAFKAFPNSKDEDEDGNTASNDSDQEIDDTDELFGLYAASWGVSSLSPLPPIPSARPISSIFFGESLMSPYFGSTNRTSMASNMRRPSAGSAHTHGPLAAFDFSELNSGKTPPNAMTDRDTPAPASQRSRPISYSSRPASMASYNSVLNNRYPRPLSLASSSRMQALGLEADVQKKRRRLSKKSRASMVTLPEPIPKNEEDPQLSLFGIMRTVWPSIGWYSRMLLFAGLYCAIIEAAATPVFAYIFARLLSTFFTPGEDQREQAQTYALVILAIAITNGLASYGLHFLFDVAAQDWVNTLKKEALMRILAQPREFFDREENNVNKIAGTLDHYGEEARNLLGRFTGIPIVMVVMMLICISWSMALCWKIAIVCMACGPIVYAALTGYSSVSNRWEAFGNEADEKVGKALYETFGNIRTVRCLTLETTFRAKFRTATTSALQVGIKRAVYTGSLFGLNCAVIYFVGALLFFYGSQIISRGEFSVTSVMETFSVLLLSITHANVLGHYIPQINIARDAGSKLVRLASLPQDSHEMDGKLRVHRAGDISFENVQFAYPTRKDIPVLHDVTFDIPRGSCTAIVGSSGSGKSTIASLLLKLYQTTPPTSEGDYADVYISGHRARNLNTSSLRSRMAIVSQSPVLFPGTIAENIAYGMPPTSLQACMDAIRFAAAAAGVADFVDSLPQGYQTVVGEGGSGLSGGQSQRLVIARALFQNPDVLILDEATSALDVESAGIVRETIQRLVQQQGVARTKSIGKAKAGERLIRRSQRDMTVIIITHAQEMMAIAENIIMLDKGRVVEEGTFEELKRNKGAFARLLRGEDGDASEKHDYDL